MEQALAGTMWLTDLRKLLAAGFRVYDDPDDYDYLFADGLKFYRWSAKKQKWKFIGATGAQLVREKLEASEENTAIRVTHSDNRMNNLYWAGRLYCKVGQIHYNRPPHPGQIHYPRPPDYNASKDVHITYHSNGRGGWMSRTDTT